ncbi:MAG TPA: hypothetical protein VGG61_15990 [Gemmataceae bacterium]|jgi:hypothetical protein
MRNRRLARPLSCLAFLLAAVPGCQALHDYRPVSVQARDAETKQPIPGAQVRISYPLTEHAVAPADSTGITGVDGVAQLRAAPYGHAGISVETTAPGYMFENKTVTVQAVQEIEAPSFFGKDAPRPVNFVVEMYAEPHPTVELVVPAGFRGLIKAAMQFRDDAPCAPGQRTFTYDVQPSGSVQIIGPPLLRRVLAPDFRAKSPDGTPLPGHPENANLGFWWLRSEGNTQFFWVGTQLEYDNIHHADERQGTGEPKVSSTPKAAGRGGHRGGKGNPSGDQSAGQATLYPDSSGTSP